MEVKLPAAIMNRHLPPFAMSKPVPITLHHTEDLYPVVDVCTDDHHITATRLVAHIHWPHPSEYDQALS